jgi:hypothetical protein
MNVIYTESYKLAHYAECHYAECRFAECLCDMHATGAVATSSENIKTKHFVEQDVSRIFSKIPSTSSQLLVRTK